MHACNNEQSKRESEQACASMWMVPQTLNPKTLNIEEGKG